MSYIASGTDFSYGPSPNGTYELAGTYNGYDYFYYSAGDYSMYVSAYMILGSNPI